MWTRDASTTTSPKPRHRYDRITRSHLPFIETAYQKADHYEMSTPVSTTVIALDVPVATTPVSAGLKANFAHLVGNVMRQLGYISPEVPSGHATGLYLTVTLAPEAKADIALRRLAAAIADFEGKSSPLRVRAVAHYGTVFRNETGGSVSYLGSAIRAAQHALENTPPSAGITATRDFSDFAASSKLPFRFEGQNAAADVQGPSSVFFVEQTAATSTAAGEQPALDPGVVQYLKKRLAEDVGPFAGPMVDMAARSVSSADLLVAKLTNEVENPKARQLFEADALAFIKSRSRK